MNGDVEQMTPIRLELGDRVRLTELGVSRSQKIRARTGVVVGPSKHYSGSASITVLFDGNVRPTTVRQSYIELENAEGSKNAVDVNDPPRLRSPKPPSIAPSLSNAR